MGSRLVSGDGNNPIAVIEPGTAAISLVLRDGAIDDGHDGPVGFIVDSAANRVGVTTQRARY